MPRFAVLDADSRVVNIVALARKEDFTHVVVHGHGHEDDLACGLSHEQILDAEHRKDLRYGEPTKFEATEAHLINHGGVELVEANLRTRVGDIYADGNFTTPVPPPPPLASHSDDILVSEIQRRGLHQDALINGALMAGEGTAKLIVDQSQEAPLGTAADASITGAN